MLVKYTMSTQQKNKVGQKHDEVSIDVKFHGMAFIDVADIGNLDVRQVTIAQTTLENLFSTF